MICKHCNKEIEDEAKFCPYCGTAIEQGEAITIDAEVVNEEIKEEAPKEAPVNEGPKFTIPDIKIDLSEFKGIFDHIKDPLLEDSLGLLPAIIVLLVSLFANVWILYASTSALFDIAYSTIASLFGTSYSASNLLAYYGINYFSFFGCGLLLTIVILVFVIASDLLANKGKTLAIKNIFTKAAGQIVVPTLFTIIGAILVSLYLPIGILFAVVAYCFVLTANIKDHSHVYIRITTVVVFLMAIYLVILFTSPVL